MPVRLDERLLLGSRPSLELPLSLQRFDSCLKFMSEYKGDWAASVRITRDFATVVLGDALFQVVGVANVIGAVCAAENVDVKSHCRASPRSGFDTTHPSQSPRSAFAGAKTPSTRPLGRLRANGL